MIYWLTPMKNQLQMMKTKVAIFINPLMKHGTTPVPLTDLSEALDYISARFEIINIDIHLSEQHRPSEFYFDFLSGLCKSVTNKICVDNYMGTKKPNVFRVDSFDTLKIIINNTPEYIISYNNSQRNFSDIKTFLFELSKY